MTYVVFGAGMMGSAAARDLAVHHPGDRVAVADIDPALAQRAVTAMALPNVFPLRVDVNDRAGVMEALEGASAAIGAVSYTVNLALTRAAIAAGVPLCDLGGNNDVVEQQLALGAEARARGIAVVPNCGLAPGLINILAVEGMRAFDSVDAIRLRVGGLPQHPRPPLNYQIVFSVEGLINEYVERAEVIRDGVLESVEAMSGLEEIAFPPPFGVLEAFNTSGGLSRLPQMLLGKVRDLDYKTIRYKGHCEKFRTLLDLGFASGEPLVAGGSVRTNREFFAELLRKKLDYGDTDVVLARATITGRRGGAAGTLVYELVDRFDEASGVSAMMRTTAYPTAVIARMLAAREITATGVLTPEMCVPGDAMIRELARRAIHITKRTTESWS